VDGASIPGWDAIPPDASIRFGTQWARERRSVVLRVPSVMIPSESNFVLNPAHPTFKRAVRIGAARPFAFDRRLLRH
jgi:RES domain-containing protein